MSNSFRIRTKPGVDTSIKVLIDQEFEYLEILSLKVLQSQIYTRQCSDYGVIVGRVSVNNGFGIPNAKVSVFIPLDSADESNPVISDLYPYKSLIDLNEDGYRYNLLPYTKSHNGHTPTGTFFTRQDVLTDPTLIEVFDKYYKYTTTTNSSGDYMIFGVPPGSQTVVLDVDLSDIGEFSLSPQDLVRMGVATPNQVAGVNFISSTNLRELPQIISINKVITVEPLWGQPEICNLGITRTDFDLSAEASIDIRPTSIFMGSIVSTNNNDIVKRNCKPRVKSGSQCSLVAGPGEILAIRQTIFKDVNGLPVLETVDLEEGGQVIDENGTWLLDVPMNLDYLITNEFGEQVISDDPKKGIPTKAKYRFKVKWNQSPSLSETVRRGYFLVPNIKEHGWEVSNIDPLSLGVNDPSYQEALKSYSFSLDWNDYADIQSGINCDDTFYLMQYNKVYTVSQLIDQYRNGSFPNQIISIKNILDEACESDVNKFPANDSVFRFDLIYFIFWIMLFLFRPILIVLIPVIHILWFVLKILAFVFSIVLAAVLGIVAAICFVFKTVLSILSIIPGKIGRRMRQWKNSLKCITFEDIKRIVNEINSYPDKLKNLKIPNLSYPDCDFCDCGDPDGLPKDEEGIEVLTVKPGEADAVESGGSSLLTQYQIVGNYFNRRSDIGFYTQDLVYQTIVAGNALGSVEDETLTPSTRVPEMVDTTTDDKNPNAESSIDDTIEYNYFTSSLSVTERLNLFNTKGKYFNDSPDNPGGGVNRIKVTFQPESNPNKFHFDNVIAIVCGPSSSNLESGGLISFQDISLSYDKNITGDGLSLNEYGTYSIIGTPINVNGTINVVYADPSLITTGITVAYNITQEPGDVNYAKFPMDVEYFQVITGMTYTQYTGMCNTNQVSIDNDWDNVNSFNNRFLSNTMTFYRIDEGPFAGENRANFNTDERIFSPIVRFNKQESQRVIFLVRGVDPNSSRVNVRYDLSRLFGYNFGNTQTIVTSNKMGGFKLNHPIKGGLKCTTHNLSSNALVDNLTGQKLYYDSFHFKPSTIGLFSFSGFTTKLHNFYSNLDKENLSFNPGTYDTDVNYFPPTLGSTTNSTLTGNYFRVTDTWTNSNNIDLPPFSPDGILVGSFITTGLNPNLNITESGTTATLQIYTDGGSGTITSSQSSVYAEIYKYSASGDEVLLNSGATISVKVPYTKNFTLRTISVPIIGTTYVSTDRLLVKIFARPKKGTNIYFGFQTANMMARLDIPNYTTPLTYYLYINNWDKTKITDLDGNYLLSQYYVTSKGVSLRAYGSEVGFGTQGNNGFIVEWEKGYTYRLRDGQKYVYLRRRYGAFNSGSDNRGYFPGENVDGGSLFYQKLDITKSSSGVDPMRAINFYYAPRYSGLTMNVGLGVSGTQIIMRSDRLPTSTSLQDNLNNSFALHSNTQFAIFTITDDGSSSSQSVASSGSGNLTNGSFDTAQEPKVFSSVIDSFSCGPNMAPLNCYYNDNNEIKVKPKSDDCWRGGGGKQDFRNGCYVLITSPTKSIISDIERVVEWTGRIQTIFAACRNVFSHLFTNNWINGTLYAFTFKNDVIYTSPTATPPNSPINRYCKDVLVFNPNNNNFFYRSSPYNLNEGFIGHKRKSPNGGNEYNLKTPTTMLDLGPRSDYLQEIIMSDDFDGYVVKDLNSTTFGDVSELLNMLIVTRLSNASFLKNLSGIGILSFFSREKLMIDGDYSQMTSINSELGVSPFEGINYPDVSGSQDPIYYNGGSENDVTFGVFFSSDTVVRDFISPKRTIISPRLPLGNVCGFSDIGVFSQSVPFYQWIIQDTDDNNIFGTQKNGWATEPIDNYVFFNYKYQDLDRLDRGSRYFRTNVQSQTQFFKSHIYSVSATTNNNYVLDASTNSWDTNEGAFPKYITVGAPYHFYFGLKTGKSAFDRFTKKWINTDTTI
jgi:hypothetical protein